MQDTVMHDAVNSIHFLWAAYILVAVANIGFAVWLGALWSRLNRKG